MGEPMAQDGGIAGLEQSLHHPRAGRSQFNAEIPPDTSEDAATQQGGASESTEPLQQRILACVLPDKQEEVLSLLRDLVATVTRLAKPTISPPKPPLLMTSEEDPGD